MAVDGKFGLQEGLDLTKSILPVIGAMAAASQLRKNEKQVKGIGKNLENTINKEKQVKALDRVQNRAFLKQADALAREKKAMAKRGAASGAINIDRGIADSYGDAVRNIAASTSARNEYLESLEDNIANANAERNNYFSDMKAKAWASAANESIKAAQNYKPAGGVASKDATKVEVDTPTTETYNLGDLWQNGKQTGNMEALASQLNNKRANMPTELLSMPYYNKG